MNSNLSTEIMIRLTPKEKDKIAKEAMQKGLKKSTYARLKLLNMID